MSTNVSRREDTLPQAKKGKEDRVAWTIIQHPSTEDRGVNIQNLDVDQTWGNLRVYPA
jgi:hypothetical protein